MQEKSISGLIISQRLLELMESKNLTQVEVARFVGVSQASVSLWLKGSIPSGIHIQKIAELLGTTVGFLIGSKDSEKIELKERSPVYNSEGVKELTEIRRDLIKLTAKVDAALERMRNKSV